jgi:serine/threonine protein kinase
LASPALAPDQKIGPYQLLHKLGAGGIGEVWKARDRKLNRIVALKFIAPGVGSTAARDLLHEARAVSALNHPNIVTIYEVGENERGQYLAMEFVNGETLRARLVRSALELAESLDIARQVCAALAAAHKNGIVHRDLKPENIMLRDDGLVKLVDFGLAKALPWGDSVTAGAGATSDYAGEAAIPATAPGVIVGTFHYMSPEQARGKPVGPPSDVFSAGIVLYEMLAREHPFRADSAIETITAILNDEPPPISTRCAVAPPELEYVLERALAKPPIARFPSGVELLEALRPIGVVTATPSKAAAPAQQLRPKPRWMQAIGAALILLLLLGAGWALRPSAKHGVEAPVQSVLVLKLRAAPDDPRASALTDEISEELDAALSKRGLRVASRSGLAAEAAADARSVGAQLGVDAVLNGTVRSAGDKLRVHVELVSTRTGFELWSQTFTGDAGDPLTAGERMAAQIAEQMQDTIGKPK